MVATGEELPALPKKWVEKIQAGEFNDCAELPQAKDKVRGTANSLEGPIIMLQAADLMVSRMLIPDFAA